MTSTERGEMRIRGARGGRCIGVQGFLCLSRTCRALQSLSPLASMVHPLVLTSDYGINPHTLPASILRLRLHSLIGTDGIFFDHRRLAVVCEHMHSLRSLSIYLS